ncbi:hypothetical protein GCM10025868_23380 [Angustibacter aerolatus]|uniref:Uncharacterized protein n=1 Tax=Angustibacter aerolatus TaxID=1162965 RepID=A0ABQ6JG02_9ACTN|nr:hypothetical protein [Angustibacter aerolatus]GMA87088.1 hypothetical protein GCM10025868_23380 [Angustibacter aerolatus]
MRDEVERWLDAGDPREGLVTGGETVLDQPLAPGGQRDVTLRLPGSALGLTGRPFGAYGLGVEVRATAGGVRDRVALRRTTLQWQGGVKEYAAQQPGLGGAVHRAAGVRAGRPHGAAGRRRRRAGQPAAAPARRGVRARGRLGRRPGAAAHPAARGAAHCADRGEHADRAGDRDARRHRRPRGGAHLPRRPARRRAGTRGARAPYADPDVDALARAKALDLLSATRAAAAGVVEQTLGVQARTDVAVPPAAAATTPG